MRTHALVTEPGGPEWQEIAFYLKMEEPGFAKSTSLCSTPKDSGTAAPQSTSSGKRPMSAALRERLRKTRRSFNASFTVAKRLRIDTEEKDCAASDEASLSKKNIDFSRLQDSPESLERNCPGHARFKSSLQKSSPCGSTENPCMLRADFSHQRSLEEKVRLVKQVQEKEDLLRRLKLVKMYRSKASAKGRRCSKEKNAYDL
ncbi:swi5-dependent recombination DNA repair protein 1 homolog isoform X3 [Struthio camelus]|uniref:swi5-dependent recombination DNA repair protein 1 homolog isoform X3 n=1 Tax=Struthio camelus TaxID=8801 RepID=UPI003603EBA8